ncbi:C-type mannose receptor 2-like isoform X4 [Epinephelus fuscoguttatus]|uniref:C-type mannose receptor 2-like isoform X1 n=1 Tax=Epinephelus fuscoguttatus TaxID=293821 RepID=UPI0020D12900|nr:C-type mannose receptor 2-like isoform X1 [Epinephelus fuscoguttatus]XP_049423927.1 C-type mannose receptor 2-like isoform X2 [Epinephelus fuscoguttatus]XP_049423928.1 C-type mannose receptor 2-like isoform X3 [Epinephelus fuscoguttatus]XP_049423929.1 C-type mannose receptor 2-like isoform X4 [Epinephelus fuscoguttatus]
MQWSLFLLLLMGQCSFFMCHLHEYHFVEEKKNWTEAQQYCREHHTDLATVSNMTDMERLRDSAQNQDGAWIGLYSTAGEDNRMWHWSLPGVEFNDTNTKWAPDEPNDKPSPANCVCIYENSWRDFHCTRHRHAFICYDERRQSNKTFHLIKDKMSWPQAQNYCREHHTDLVSGDQQLEDNEFKTEIKSQKEVWIGLFRDSWRWSDGSNSSFRYWDLESDNDYHHNRCAMIKSNGKWRADKCDHKKPFFCYNASVSGTTTKKGTTAGPSSSTVTEDKTQDKMILIKENMTWEDALYYCEEKHHDLVSITNPDEQKQVQEKAKKANSPYVWLGLRYTCTLGFWFWIDDKMVTYKNWDTDVPADDCDMSGAMDRGGEHKWFKKNDNEKFNFICSTCQTLYTHC